MHQLQWGDLSSLFPHWCSLWGSTSGPVMVPFSAGLLSLSILEQIISRTLAKPELKPLSRCQLLLMKSKSVT